MIVFGLVARCPAAGSGGCPIPGTRFVSAGSSDPRDRGPLPSPVFSSAAAILVNFTEPRYAARLLNAVAGCLCGCCACRTFAERGGGMSVWCCACHVPAGRVPSSERRGPGREAEQESRVCPRSETDGGAEGIDAIGALPGEVWFLAAEMTVGRRLGVDRPEQVEIRDECRWAQVEQIGRAHV